MSERLSFDDVWKRLHPNRHFIGPRALECDYRFIAGLLFRHWNDGSVRRIVAYTCETPYVDVAWYRDFSGCVGSARVYIHPNALEQLLVEHLLLPASGSLEWSLNARGYRRVVEEWFQAESMDAFAAGLRLTSNGPEWPQASH